MVMVSLQFGHSLVVFLTFSKIGSGSGALLLSCRVVGVVVGKMDWKANDDDGENEDEAAAPPPNDSVFPVDLVRYEEDALVLSVR